MDEVEVAVRVGQRCLIAIAELESRSRIVVVGDPEHQRTTYVQLEGTSLHGARSAT